MMKSTFFSTFMLFTYCLLFSLSTVAQLKVDVGLDTDKVLLGEPIELTLSAKLEDGSGRLKWPQIDTLEGLFIIEKGKVDSIKEGNDIWYKQVVRVTGFDTGVFTIKSFEFINELPTEQYDSVFSGPLKVTVVATPLTEQDKQVSTAADEPLSRFSWSYIIIASAVVILLLLVGLWWKKERSKVTTTVIGKGLDPKQEALQALRSLSQGDYNTSESQRVFYSDLTFLLKRYLDKVLLTNTLEMTTDDMRYWLKSQTSLRQYETAIEQILAAADLSKFAQAPVQAEVQQKALSMTKELIMSIDKRELVAND